MRFGALLAAPYFIPYDVQYLLYDPLYCTLHSFPPLSTLPSTLYTVSILCGPFSSSVLYTLVSKRLYLHTCDVLYSLLYHGLCSTVQYYTPCTMHTYSLFGSLHRRDESVYHNACGNCAPTRSSWSSCTRNYSARKRIRLDDLNGLARSSFMILFWGNRVIKIQRIGKLLRRQTRSSCHVRNLERDRRYRHGKLIKLLSRLCIFWCARAVPVKKQCQVNSAAKYWTMRGAPR